MSGGWVPRLQLAASVHGEKGLGGQPDLNQQGECHTLALTQHLGQQPLDPQAGLQSPRHPKGDLEEQVFKCTP